MYRSLRVTHFEPAQQLTINEFDQKLATYGIDLRATRVETLQVNVGKLCNQACRHWHVDASPARTEIMKRETVEQVIAALDKFRIPTLDITGGAPELNPSFRSLVSTARAQYTRPSASQSNRYVRASTV